MINTYLQLTHNIIHKVAGRVVEGEYESLPWRVLLDVIDCYVASGLLAQKQDLRRAVLSVRRLLEREL